MRSEGGLSSVACRSSCVGVVFSEACRSSWVGVVFSEPAGVVVQVLYLVSLQEKCLVWPA